MEIKTLSRVSLIAALYVVLTFGLAPISYGPLQFRISEMLKPLAILAPWAPFAFMIGTSISNLTSPFGPMDYVFMPFVDALAAWVCWKMRAKPVVALFVQALIMGVSAIEVPTAAITEMG